MITYLVKIFVKELQLLYRLSTLILSLKVRLRLSLETQMLELQWTEHFQKRLVVS